MIRAILYTDQLEDAVRLRCYSDPMLHSSSNKVRLQCNDHRIDDPPRPPRMAAHRSYARPACDPHGSRVRLLQALRVAVSCGGWATLDSMLHARVRCLLCNVSKQVSSTPRTSLVREPLVALHETNRRFEMSLVGHGVHRRECTSLRVPFAVQQDCAKVVWSIGMCAKHK